MSYQFVTNWQFKTIVDKNFHSMKLVLADNTDKNSFCIR